MIKEFYTAASTFPAKLLHQEVIKDKKIIPLHLQLSPTNVCNLNCDFCSCSDRDKKKQLSFEQVKYILDVCAERGTRAITITGGGEPLMHPKINEIIEHGTKFILEIEVGLVTNGILLDKLKHHDNLIWCRISSDDNRTPAYDKIEQALLINPQTDWAVSYVVTKEPNYKIMKELINFANENNFTHVRLVSDLCDLDNTPSMEKVRWKLDRLGIVSGFVIPDKSYTIRAIYERPTYIPGLPTGPRQSGGELFQNQFIPDLGVFGMKGEGFIPEPLMRAIKQNKSSYAGVGAGGGGGDVILNFDGANLSIRDDSDIPKLARAVGRELSSGTSRYQRGVGVR